MKTFISKLLIASILSITLLSVVSISSYVYQKTSPYRTAAVSQAQPGAELLSGSYSSMINILNASSGR
jgi:hypothetical protein